MLLNAVMVFLHCQNEQQVVNTTTATSEVAVPSPRKQLGSFLHRVVAQSHSPVKASPPRVGAQQRTASPLTRRTRQTRAELSDMSTQVCQSE